MKVGASEAARIVKAPPQGLVAALVFGPDAGLVRERSEALLKTVVPDLSDPFRVADLDADALAADPARLADEAAALAMMGGRRVVRVRSAGNAHAKLFEAFLADPRGDALVVVEAGDLNRSSALRKTFEAAKNAAAIPCYADSARDLAAVVRDTLREAGLAIGAEALAEAVGMLGADRGVTLRELEKLALYARGQKEVTVEDVRAVIGDEAAVHSEEAFDAAGLGDFSRLDLALARLTESGNQPAATLRGAMGHFQRLLLAKEQVARGERLDAVLRGFRPPLHFSRVSAFRAQAARWNADALSEALTRLYAAEALCKTTGVPSAAVCGRALYEVAMMARKIGPKNGVR
jgi:DNA polymerase-3 subunit delta